LVRRLFRGRLNLRLQYALWLLVAARLLLPLPSVQSSVSVLNVLEPGVSILSTGQPREAQAPKSPAIGATDLPTGGNTENTSHGSPVAPATPERAEIEPLATGSNERENAPRAIWLAGVIAIGLWFIAQNLWFYTRLRKTREKVSIPDIRLPAYISPHVKSPCLFGLSPAIYLPPNCLEKGTLRYVLAHEETHYRQRDHLWTYLYNSTSGMRAFQVLAAPPDKSKT
jgi:bla regulator protein BlaR1